MIIPQSIGLVALCLIEAVNAKSFWSSKPATFGTDKDAEYILKTAYPVGNGKLGGKQASPI
jgi:alpha-L-fucosidase 2